MHFKGIANENTFSKYVALNSILSSWSNYKLIIYLDKSRGGEYKLFSHFRIILSSLKMHLQKMGIRADALKSTIDNFQNYDKKLKF